MESGVWFLQYNFVISVIQRYNADVARQILLTMTQLRFLPKQFDVLDLLYLL